MYFMNPLQIKFVMMKTLRVTEIVLAIMMVKEDSQLQFRNNQHNSQHMIISSNVISKEMETDLIYCLYFSYF